MQAIRYEIISSVVKVVASMRLKHAIISLLVKITFGSMLRFKGFENK